MLNLNKYEKCSVFVAIVEFFVIIVSTIITKSGILMTAFTLVSVVGIVLNICKSSICPLIFTINSYIYAIMGMINRFYGEVIMNVILGTYYLISFVIYLAKIRQNKFEKKINIERPLTKKEYLIICVILFVSTCIFGNLLFKINTNRPYINAFSMCLGFIVAYLVVRRDISMWFASFIQAIVGIILWVIGTPDAFKTIATMILYYSFCIIHDIFGTINYLINNKKLGCTN